jgi:ammonia channel protein AmtB
MENVRDSDRNIRTLLREMAEPENTSNNDVAIIAKLFQMDKKDFRPNNITSIVLGTFILWVCWLFFNAGSTYQMA